MHHSEQVEIRGTVFSWYHVRPGTSTRVTMLTHQALYPLSLLPVCFVFYHHVCSSCPKIFWGGRNECTQALPPTWRYTLSGPWNMAFEGPMLQTGTLGSSKAGCVPAAGLDVLCPGPTSLMYKYFESWGCMRQLVGSLGTCCSIHDGVCCLHPTIPGSC